MKTKKLNGKLYLNKKTIVHLDNRDLKVVYGGSLFNTQCVTCVHECTTHVEDSCIHTGCPDPVTD